MPLLKPAEVSARISLALQRTSLMQGPSAGRLALGDAVIDFNGHQVIAQGGAVARLTPKEADLLGYLVVHANKVLSHRELLQAAWGPEFGTEHERLHVVVRQLRRKIEARPSQPVYLLTVPHVGYQLYLPSGLLSNA